MESARAAYEGAQAALDAVPGRIEGVEAFRHSLQNALGLVSGQEVDLTVAPPSELDMGMDAFPFDPGQIEGLGAIEGPEALLAILDAMDLDAVKDQLPPGMGFDDPQALEMIRGPFNAAKNDVRVRVESGEITTMEQLMQAFMQALMQRMMGG
jgi:hypothetical protein